MGVREKCWSQVRPCLTVGPWANPDPSQASVVSWVQSVALSLTSQNAEDTWSYLWTGVYIHQTSVTPLSGLVPLRKAYMVPSLLPPGLLRTSKTKT